MGKFIRLGTAITDLEAPILPHPTGVAGFTNRYIPAHLAGPDGTIVSQLPDSKGSLVLKNLAGTPAETLERETGFDHVKTSTGAVAGGQLNAATSGLPQAGHTVSALVRIPLMNTPNAIQVNGVGLSRAANGVYNLRGPNNETFLAALNTAGIVLATWTMAGAVSDLYLNGVRVAGGTFAVAPTTTAVNVGPYGTGVECHTAELILWPTKLTAAEVTAHYTAMKKHYPLIP